MGLIFDSSVLIASERGLFRLDALAETFAEEEMFIAAITASELLHGVERATAPAVKQARALLVERWLSQLVVLDFDLPTARLHASLWAELARNGTQIGPHDLLIAATARHHGLTLATLNTKEFTRIPGLKLADTAPFVVVGPKRV